MRIAVDAMGGDYAPRAVVQGAHAAAVSDGVRVLLVGRRKTLQRELRRLRGPRDAVEIVDAPEVVEMDEPATTPLRRKKDSSIRIGCELVREGRAHGLVSFGNTGAVLSAAKMVIGTVQGVDRPALAAVFPIGAVGPWCWMWAPTCGRNLRSCASSR